MLGDDLGPLARLLGSDLGGGQNPQVDDVARASAGGQPRGDLQDDRPQVVGRPNPHGGLGQKLPGAQRPLRHGGLGQLSGEDVGVRAGMRVDQGQDAVGGQVLPRGDVAGQNVDLLGVGGGVHRPRAQCDGGTDEGQPPGQARISPGGAPSAGGTCGVGGPCGVAAERGHGILLIIRDALGQPVRVLGYPQGRSGMARRAPGVSSSCHERQVSDHC